MNLKGVIFDIDGTLVDSNDAHANAWVEAFREFDIAVTFEQVRPLIGMGADKLMPKVAGLRPDEPGGVQITKRRSTIFKAKYLPTLQAFPQAPDLLARIHGRGLHLAVATSAKAEELNDLLEVAGVRGLIEVKTTASDVEHSKPDPDAVASALAKLNVDASSAVMIGDSPYDIEAATRVGIDTIAFRCGGFSDEDLKGAIAIYDGPADLFERYDASILATRRTAG